MKKLFLTLLFILIFSTSAFSETIKSGVTYSVEDAKKIAFANVQKRLPKNLVKSNLIDPNFDENKALVEKNIFETKDRIITYFDDGDYCITYKSDLYTDFHYNSIGQLYFISVRTKIEDKPPYWFYNYNISGKLFLVVFCIKDNELYGFDAKGNKTDYCINDILYNKNGIPIKKLN